MEEYRDWLLSIVEFRRKNFDDLMNQLLYTPFVWSIENDRNRKEDGMELRRMYFSGIRGEKVPDFPCSVLEVLVALARRIDKEYIGEPGEPHPGMIFWRMMRNLGLDKYTVRRYNQGAVLKAVSKWLLREFNEDGEGGIFPMKHTVRNQKILPIWNQMTEFLSENFRTRG